uniref:Uncharacterized abhydrolase domain-containing protein DDB_G0269086-like n=1 Tax=Acanthochromis polyacanthus TaxID=80966 RepID=A0A3Q1GA79_9TELE
MSLADQQWSPTSVQVTVLQARGLRIKGKSGTNDAYAVMQVGKEKFQTSVVEKSVAPVWKEEAAFDLPPLLHGAHGSERGTLHVHVLHRALVGPDKLLGQAVINLLQLSEDKTRSKTEWFKLLDKTGKPDKDRGEVLLDIQFMRNNMTASMFDLSAAGKSRSRLGKFKDKVRGKKKESDSGSNTLPSFTQILTDSEEEANGGEVAASKDGKSKKHKMKSLFSPKSNLQKNMSQSMSVLPAKNSTLSGSQSSGLNVDSSEGKKKFKFKIHKRSGSSDSKDPSSGLQKQLPVEQSNLCINGSHVYCEEPPTRTSRIGSNFSLASSGHGSMEEVPENSPPSVDSLRAVRQYSPWTEEEEEVENVKEDESRREEEEEKVRRQQEELERLSEEEERRKVEEQRVKREEEERMRREERERLAEEERRLEEQERRKIEEEEEKMRVEEEKAQEERRRRQEEEEERVRREEERKLAEEKRRLEEEERRREEEERRREEEEEERRREEEERARKEKEEYERLEEERMKQEEQRRRIEEEERIRKEEQERIKMEEKRRQEEEERARKEKEEMERLAKEEEERRRIEEEEKVRREERIRRERKEKEEARRLEKEKLKRDAEEQKKMENKNGQKTAGKKSKLNSSADVSSTNPFDENYSYNPFEEIPDSPPGAREANVQQRCQSAVSSLGSKTVSSDEKELVSAQREKRPAPQPPGRNQAEKLSQREQDASARHLGQINTHNKDKEVKTISVPPQRSVQVIDPISRSPADSKNGESSTQSSTAKGTTGKHSKRHAPPRPRSVEEEPESTLTAETKHTVYGLNPFEDDEDENDPGSVCWPPAADKDAASQTKTKSSKVAHAPPPPQNNGTVITQNTEGGCVADDTVPDGAANKAHDPKPEAVNPGQVQESPVQNTVEACVKKEGPPVAARRLQPVKPLNSVEQQSVSVVQGENQSTGIHSEARDKAKVNDAGLKGPFSQLTQEELISLVLKQENQLSERDKKISELEQYIDNLLVRVIEEQPSILMSMNSLKKAA